LIDKILLSIMIGQRLNASCGARRDCERPFAQDSRRATPGVERDGSPDQFGIG
jgi:hypothetical protein